MQIALTPRTAQLRNTAPTLPAAAPQSTTTHPPPTLSPDPPSSQAARNSCQLCTCFSLSRLALESLLGLLRLSAYLCRLPPAAAATVKMAGRRHHLLCRSRLLL